MKIYGKFEKVEKLEDGTVKVWGIASSEAVDAEGEVIKADAMRKALPSYMEYANVREMHDKKAAGVVFEANVGDDGKTHIGAHIIDTEACKKVQAQVYKGFSIGGRVKARDEANKSIITDLDLVEISLVDRPCNPEARISLFKADVPDEVADQFAKLASSIVDSGFTMDEVLAKLATRAQPDKATTDLVSKREANKALCVKNATNLLKNPKAAPTLASLGALLADRTEKGLWTVSRLAELIDAVRGIQADCQWEAAYEGDESAIPAELKDAVRALGAILISMAEEEIGELFEEDNEIVEAAARIDALQKKGAKHSAATMGHLQSMHDHLSKMTDGKVCGGADKSASAALCKALHAKEGDDLAKAAETLHKTLHEAQAALAKVQGEREALMKALNEANTTLEAAAKEIEKLKAEPAPGGPAVRQGLHVVAKTDDGKATDGKDGKPDEPTAKVLQIHGPNLHDPEAARLAVKAAFANGPRT